MTDLAKLKELADKATPGPWILDETIAHEKSYGINGVRVGHGDGVCTTHNHGSRSWSQMVAVPAQGHSTEDGQDAANNMRYIAAANPKAVLRLIEAYEVLNSAVRKVHDDEETGHWGPDVTMKGVLANAIAQAEQILKRRINNDR